MQHSHEATDKTTEQPFTATFCQFPQCDVYFNTQQKYETVFSCGI